MGSISQKNNIGQLHKGLGPGLFQYRSVSYPTTVESPLSTPRTTRSAAPVKETVVKCMEQQDANTMFSKRIREMARRRDTHHNVLSTSKPAPPSRKKPRAKVKDPCDLYVKEKMFNNTRHKLPGFPPPNFMPRWNPRHKDRTYCGKVIYEDPWSLSVEERADLKKRTGLRFKSMSRHYQFKIGLALPVAKDLDTCTCFINHCNHCNQSHQHRCPLHTQLLDPLENDCKAEVVAYCPFAKNLEDISLQDISDPTLYISEVVRRLKAGEIREVGPFPMKFLDEKFAANGSRSNLNEAESEATIVDKNRPETDEVCTQTEPFKMDVDMKGFFKENISQTQKMDKEEPLMLNMIKKLQSSNVFKPFPTAVEMATQVTPFMIKSFEHCSAKTVEKVSDMIMAQSIREMYDELQIERLQVLRAVHTEELANIHRSMHFRYLCARFRASAYLTEEDIIRKEGAKEDASEKRLAATSFAQCYFKDFLAIGMSDLRGQGFIVNQDFIAIQTVLTDAFNDDVLNTLTRRDYSQRLLDDMITHAVEDLELDCFRGRMVEGNFLAPINLDAKSLKELVAMRESLMEVVIKLQKALKRMGWTVNHHGELVRWSTSDGSSSASDIDTFLKSVRVSVDSSGDPKYLVDIIGRPLPINPKWLKYLYSQMTTEAGVLDTTKYFDIILEESSLLSDFENPHTTEEETTQDDNETELDTDDENEIPDERPEEDDDHGHVVFKRPSDENLEDVDFSDL